MTGTTAIRCMQGSSGLSYYGVTGNNGSCVVGSPQYSMLHPPYPVLFFCLDVVARLVTNHFVSFLQVVTVSMLVGGVVK